MQDLTSESKSQAPSRIPSLRDFLEKYQLKILTLLSVLIIAAFVFWREQVKSEILKVTYEFFLIGVIGGWFSYQYKRREQAAAARDARRVLQREMLTKVIEAYGNAKKVRRLLRARAIGKLGTPEAFVRKEPYLEQMECLMDIQLEFEALKHRAENNPDLFPEKLGENLGCMEGYLNQILEDYERHRVEFRDSTSPSDELALPLKELGSLEEFTAPLSDKTKEPRKQRSFRVDFADPFHNTVQTLQKVIIEPDLQRRRRL